jgi:carotenoid cleavage dioxygenase
MPTDADVVANHFLSGAYAPIHDEVSVVDLAVEGQIPRELHGTYLRIGPNPIAPADPETHHWFAGDGMVHAITIEDGRARYGNRWIRTDRAAALLGERPPGEQPPDVIPVDTAVANTGLVAHAGRTLALFEVALPVEIGLDGSTTGRFDFGGQLRSPMTAHPKVDPRTGEMHFFGYDIFGPPYLRYHVADAAGALVRSEEVTLPGPSMVHDMAITERHVIWLDLPVLFDQPKLAQGLFPYSWRPDYGARVGVMPRHGGDADTRWFEIEPCYVFHVLNAYDDGANVIVDVVRYDRLFADDPTGPTDAPPVLVRWTIDMNVGRVASEVLDGRPQEFPRVADRTVGVRHRFGYAVTEHEIVQHDLDRGTTAVHPLGPDAEASEALFVPASAQGVDDEGWVVTIVHRGSEPSEFVVLDASAMDKPPVARVRLPQRVPLGFHALWVDGG